MATIGLTNIWEGGAAMWGFRARAVLFPLVGVSLLVPSVPTSGGEATERVAPISGQDGGGREEYHGQVAEAPSGMTIETLRADIGSDFDVDDAVLGALLDHPGFLDTPAVMATSGQSETRENDYIREDVMRFRHIGGGWFETNSHHRNQGGPFLFYETTSRNMEFLAGLIVVATRNESTLQWPGRPQETGSMSSRIVAVESISGRLFPIAIGNALSMRIVWILQFDQETREFTSEYEWRVTGTTIGRSVGLPTDEEVFEVTKSGVDVGEPDEDPVLSTTKFYFVPSLGIAVNSEQYDDEYPDRFLEWKSLE